MARSRGGAETRRMMLALPQLLRERVLPGAARAGGKVIAEEAQLLLGGKQAEGPGGQLVLIADAVKVRVRSKGETIRARVLLDGAGAYVGRWLERGTAPHFISVDNSQRGGRTAARINRLEKDGPNIVAGARRVNEGERGSIVIGGNFVGTTVHHPGARPEPFMRPARDHKEAAAIAAAQAYIARAVTRRGIVVAADPEDDA